VPSFPIVDVAIGVIFLYLTLSLIITASNELLASVLARRQKTLILGIRNLLGDDLTAKLYQHPLIRSLCNDDKLPSYIPSRSFALALLDLIAPTLANANSAPSHDPRVSLLQNQLQGSSTQPPTATSPAPSQAGAAAKLASQLIVDLPEPVQHTLRVLFAEAEHDVEQFKTQLELWFNNGMERVSGWYKRETQFILLVLAIVLTIAANADTISIVGTLWRDPAVRTAAVTQAQVYLEQVSKNLPVTTVSGTSTVASGPATTQVANTDDLVAATKGLNNALDRLDTSSLPLGWERAGWPGLAGEKWLVALNQHSLGWLMTAFAISLGAPFWFDMLNKIMSVRGAGKAPADKPKGTASDSSTATTS
jgi:hypothetical protein